MAPLKFARRVARELAAYRAEPPDVAPEMALRDGKMDRLLFLVRGPADTPYFGGEYVLEMRLPPEYPMAPPELRMLTPSGRFQTDQKICTSFSSFHRESWSPMYTCSSLVLSLVSFMLDEGGASLGSIQAPVEERRRLAAASAAFNRSRGLRRHFDAS